ncbi:hypothetical protein D3C71_2215410 [compost metagenome]
MQARIAELLPASEDRDARAQALAVAVDGAIVRAACDASPDAALASLKMAIDAFAYAGDRASR